MRLFPSRLGRRLFGSLVALSFGASVLVGLFFEWAYRKRIVTDMENRVAAAASLLAVEYQSGVFEGERDHLETLVHEMGKASGQRITIVAPDGKVLADSDENPKIMANHADRPEIRGAIESGKGSVRRYSETLHTDMLYFAKAIRVDATLRGVVRVAVPKAILHEGVATARRVLFWSLLLSLLISLVVSGWIADSVEDPLLEIEEVVSGIRQGDLDRRVSALVSADFASLASAINHMASELRHRTASTSEAKEKLDLALSALNGGILTVNSENRLAFWNESSRRLLDWVGLPEEGRPIEDLLRVSALLEITKGARETGTVQRREVTLFRGGVERTLAIHGIPCPVEGKPGSMVVIHDLTDLRNLERTRQDFVVNASHELRTPLAVIKGYVDTLREGGVEDAATRRRFLDQLSANVDRLAALADDLLSLSKIESREAAPTPETLDGRALVAAAAERFRPAAEKKSLGLSTDLPAGETLIRTDGTALARILDNLLDNAVKYTSEGKIVLRLRAEGDHAAIDVEDTGIGIPKADQGRIFERFYRVDKARSLEAGGTGLGLSIVKHLAAQIGTTVEVESEPGRGSRFTVRISTS